MTSDLSITYLDNDSLGYGRMGQEIVAALGRQIGMFYVGQNEPTGTHLHLSIPTHLLKWYEGQRLVCLTMFESAHLPEAFRETMHHFDTILVPSEQNRELFSRYHPDVRVIDLGVDPLVWKPTPRIKPTTRFNFLIGGSGIRKGGDVAFRAFREAFADGWDGPEPWLIMKSPRPNDFHGERVTQINGRIPAEDEVRLYETAHCYLQPSRGEGFGMQPLQAIVQGCPTILTDAHGHKAFSDYGWKIPATLEATPRGSFMLGDAGDWWEPDVQVLAEHMRDIYNNYQWATNRAWDMALQAHRRFTWDNCVSQILTHLMPLRPYTGSGQIVTPTPKKYLVRVNKEHAADIAGHSFRWSPGQDYWEIADIKRILFEGGFLEPVCVLNDDPGLTEEQVERARLVSGRDATCPTCHQKLNSQPTQGDLFEAGAW